MSKPQYETRVLEGINLETRDDGTRVITGYPIVFNSLSHDLGGFREVIKPEAIKRTMESEQDVRAFVEHDSKQKLGRRKSNTLRLAVDDKGIKAEIDVPPTTIGNDLVADMQRGEYDGMSFRFYKLRDNWKVDGDTRVREVTDMVFDEISVVGSPAYANTSVALRSMAEAFEALPDKDKQLKLMAMELRIAELDS